MSGRKEFRMNQKRSEDNKWRSRRDDERAVLAEG
jgi:hypothetical protein